MAMRKSSASSSKGVAQTVSSKGAKGKGATGAKGGKCAKGAKGGKCAKGGSRSGQRPAGSGFSDARHGDGGLQRRIIECAPPGRAHL